MNVLVWILQVLLALAFLAAGVMKISQPRNKLATNMGWVEDFSDNTVKLIGALELLAGIGLLLPAVTGVATVLVPLAAVGLALQMVLAALTHRRRGELQMIGINAVLLLLAVVVAWARRSEEHTSELQSRPHLVCRLLLEKKNADAPQEQDEPQTQEGP